MTILDAGGGQSESIRRRWFEVAMVSDETPVVSEDCIGGWSSNWPIRPYSLGTLSHLDYYPMFPSLSGRLRKRAPSWTMSYRKRYFLLELRGISSTGTEQNWKDIRREVSILNECVAESLHANSMHIARSSIPSDHFAHKTFNKSKEDE
jgi:hypothetical protein